MLFLPNNHSRSRIFWEPVSADSAKKILNILTGHYGQFSKPKIFQVKAWETLSNNYKICLPDGRVFLLRRHLQHRDSGLLDRINKILLQLSRFNLPVPRFIKTTTGEDYVSDGGEVWQLFEFIFGQYFKGTKEEIEKVGLEVARLHQALDKISSSGLPLILPRISLKKWQKFLVQILSVCPKLDCKSITQALENNSNFPIKFQKKIIHSDLHPHNILSNQKGGLFIIDFGNLVIGDPRLDLANAAHRFARQSAIYRSRHEKQPKEKIFLDSLSVFLKAYSSISELKDGFYLELPFWMRETILRKISQLVAWWERDQIDKDKLIKEFEKFSLLLKEVSLVEEYYVKKKIK